MRAGTIIAVSAGVLALAGCGGGGTTTVRTTVTTTASSTATAATGTSSEGTHSSSSVQTTPILHHTSFRSPTGNIGCVLLGGIARCDIRRRSWSPPPHPASCPNVVDFGQGLQLGRTGAGRFVCAGDTALDPSAPKLAYGTEDAAGGFLCASDTSGMTCTRAGHGFFLSEQRYRLF